MTLQINKVRLRWLRLLMVCAQLMLTGLVVQWMSMQYHEKERELNSKIENLCINTEKQLIDSMLMKTLVVPAVDSNVCVKASVQLSQSDDSLFRFQNRSDSVKKRVVLKQGMTISIGGQYSPKKKDENGQFNIVSMEKDSLIISGIRMFITRMEDSLESFTYISNALFSGLDSIRYLSKLQRGLDSISTNLKAILRPDTQDSIFSADFGFYYPVELNGGMYVLSVNGSSRFIWFQLIQPLIFAVLMLLIAGLSFIIAFRSLKKQMEVNIVRGDFISNMSHELKTPVATVKVALEALNNYNQKNDPEKLSEYLFMAGKEMDRLGLLIDRILSISRLTANHHKAVAEQIDFRKLCKEVVQQFSPMIIQAGARVELYSDPGTTYVLGDKLQLQGVIFNLLDNALKYAGPGPVVEIAVRKPEGHISVSVSDNGPGIATEFQKKIFEKFFRVPSGNLHTVKGSGLGLSYAELVAHLHGGTLVVSSGENGGSVFTLTLPEYG